MSRTIEEIEREEEIYHDMVDKILNADHDKYPTLESFQAALAPHNRKLGALSREKRMIMPVELSELSDFGHVMSLKDFIECVKEGGFIDYDGFGRYVKDGHETNIDIYLSDVKHKAIRTEFDTIIWFNR